MQCLHCNQITANPRFCSRSCSSSFNNKAKPKRMKKVYLCQTCGIPITRRATFCHSCKIQKGDDMTLQNAIYHTHHKSSAYALVRTRARAIAKLNNMNSCSKCGYSRHVEIAHIKPISSYPLDTMVSIVNAIDNLLALCPNCHWDFDHPSAS